MHITIFQQPLQLRGLDDFGDGKIIAIESIVTMYHLITGNYWQ